MDTISERELLDIKIELQSIINELKSISCGIKKDFCGIGNDRCGASIDSVINQYEIVKRKLNNIDTTSVTEEFLAKQSTGSGRGGSR